MNGDDSGTPFDNIESALEYVRLLTEAVEESQGEIRTELEAAGSGMERRKKALLLVSFKLEKLDRHMTASCRILNDLRTLRRLLLEERRVYAYADQQRLTKEG